MALAILICHEPMIHHSAERYGELMIDGQPFDAQAGAIWTACPT
jgi:hypothetical protein